MHTTTEISKFDDTIDSREIIERIEYLEGQMVEGEILDDDEMAELVALTLISNECRNYDGDWNYGATLVRDTYFTEYVQELVSEIGDIPSDLPAYLADNIDWDGVADHLKADYSSVDFDGVDYWIRNT